LQSRSRAHSKVAVLGTDARIVEADDRIRPLGDHPHRNRLATGRRLDGIDRKRGERCVPRALEHRHQVRLPLISTRGRVQIGKGFDCTCSMTQRANRWATACWMERGYLSRFASRRAPRKAAWCQRWSGLSGL
jgi:hypothetical protein